MAIPYLACMSLVASLYNLPPRVLPSIHRVEGGAPGSVHRNRDGSEDYGVMQINSRWLPALSAYTGLPPDTVRERLILRPCFNIAAGGAILRVYLDETRGDLMRAIGNYHSHTSPLNLGYQAKVMRSAAALFATPPYAAPPSMAPPAALSPAATPPAAARPFAARPFAAPPVR